MSSPRRSAFLLPLPFLPALALAALAALMTGAPDTASAQSGLSGRSRLAANTEPGAMYIEDILPKPVRLAVAGESVIYYQLDLQRPLGAMAPGTPVQLVAMAEGLYKVRGRARHGDVAGWMKMDDLRSADPKLAEKLKAFFDRQKAVDEVIANKQVALGMTVDEVKASLGNPTRKSSKISAAGREEALEYSIFERVPQITTGRDVDGNLVQRTIYVKVEVGRLTVAFKDNIVTEIQETMGNPLGPGGVKIIPGPITVF